MSAAAVRMAHSPQWLTKILDAYSKAPEFVREDLVEGLLVGGGIGIPVAMMANQDPHESAAAVLGGITAATLGGALSRKIGAGLGKWIHEGELPQGGYRYNLGRVMGRKDMLLDTLSDMSGVAPVPKITGEEFGRAIGRGVGDEVFGIAGTMGALGLAQAMDGTPDEQPQPGMGQVAAGTIPGAAIGLLSSGLMGGMVDTVGLNRALYGEDAEPTMDLLRRNTVFRKRNGPPAAS